MLAKHFLRHYWSRHRDTDLPPPKLMDATVHALCGHGWPGNVRELQNLIEHVVVLAEPNSQIKPHDLPFAGTNGPPTYGEAIPVVGSVDGVPYHEARGRVLADFERRYLTALLNRAAGNMSKAARLAGVDRTTLYRLMEKQKMQRETIMVESDNQ